MHIRKSGGGADSKIGRGSSVVAALALVAAQGALANPGGRSTTTHGMTCTSIQWACPADTAETLLLSRGFFGSIQCIGGLGLA
jgi:hypothetical protein